MQEQVIAGTKVLVKRGTIESTGTGQSTPLFSQINGVTFDDGEAIREFVQVESGIASWLSPGVEGTFVLAKGPGKVLLLAAVETDKGLRVANPKFATHITAEATGHLVWYGLFAVGMFFLVITPFFIFTAPIFLTLLSLAVKGLMRLGPYSAFLSVVKALERTRQLPTGTSDTAGAPAAMAA